MSEGETFLYFGYGSNLWTKRIHENNPSAKMKDVALLKGHKLDFGHMSQRWKGASANILEDEASHVYGVLWELSTADQPNLDRQEGVLDNIYQRKQLKVQTTKGEIVDCMAYEIRPETRAASFEKYGVEKMIPSKRYKNVIIQGAKEHNLPPEYIDFLEQIKDNGYDGEVNVNIPLTAQ